MSIVRVARAALHYGEEPVFGEKSGAVFFSGCSLRCVFCQNDAVSRHGFGKNISTERLAQIFRELEEQGAENIDLVTGGHFAERIAEAMEIYRPKVPVIWNSGGYDRPETLKLMEPYITYYLPDIKYADNALAAKFSCVRDYADTAFAAVGEMIRQKGKENVIVRHLVLPLHVKNTEAVLRRIAEEFGNDTWISLLLQYTPVVHSDEYPELNRVLTKRECARAAALLDQYGFTNGYIQERESAEKKYIPEFDLTGV